MSRPTDPRRSRPSAIAVRVKPSARRAAVGGRHDGPLGPALVVAVREPAVDGRATRAAIQAVAGALGLRARDLAVRLGAAGRDKLLEVTDPPAGLADRVAALRDSPPASARSSRRGRPRPG